MSQSSLHALALRVDRDASLRLPAQLAEQIRTRVRDGVLGGGARLPSTRAVATAVGVSRAVASAAYEQLVAEGWLESRTGAGTYVRRVDVPEVRADRTATVSRTDEAPVVDLRPGEPWTPGVASAAWRRAWREVAHAPPPAGYPDPRGLPELREAVAAHVTRTRGLPCTAERVMITSGTTHGLTLLLHGRRGSGAAIAVEDPGYRAAAQVAVASGWTVWDAPVDAFGLDPAALADAPESVAAVYATPSHQYPLGVLMPIDRRVELLAWARARDALVIEDDYDSEFRYDVAPLPTLADLDPRRVVYLGTVSKTIGAGVRMGWLVAEPAVVERLAQAREVLHDFPPWPIQRAILSLLRDGEWDRFVRAARRRYARRDRLVERTLAPYGRLSGVGAGIHTTLLLDGETAAAVAADAARNGVSVATVAESARGRTDVAGLVIGYGNVSDDALQLAIRQVESSLRRTLSG
ncbi:MocR-like pyridoxine biosynthesis transcription factor PdxR [Solicola gregarius]|uniref:PLP-dependent aminotransferase family protein n=1 Tax=Solicola gregarius TaxID=2908642 RepID=A0AA46TH89_9ACTN|nr:PLP-dependent aminotransferase family protein [Solicola gregarius]UYM05281.1 PLP-dependent aminotransferase family protein [Solicola gregarius]